jgi:hypothetical protein
VISVNEINLRNQEDLNMPSPFGPTNSPSLQPALELIYLATLEPALASRSLRKLLLNNPNYFENLTENSFKVVLNLNGDTDYESLGCVRYIPLLDRVYASINIRQDAGYSFRVGNRSSKEYVRFYLSYDQGVTWQDKGLSAVNVLDEPGEKLRMHLVTRKIDLCEDYVCVENGAQVRAILSWNTPPPACTPGWTPLWGNIAETQIQIEPLSVRRTRDLRTKSPVRFADKVSSMAGLGLPFDSADGGPVAVMSTGHFSESALQPCEYPATVA